MGFPGRSAGKESTCNAGDPGSIPGWGRFSGEGIGYPLQYYWASLVAQTVKNLPALLIGTLECFLLEVETNQFFQFILMDYEINYSQWFWKD